jgi:CBS domain-containing protein
MTSDPTQHTHVDGPGIRHTVGDLMAVEPIVVASDAPLSEAVRLMDHHRVSGLPVVGAAGDVVGVISQTDVTHARATEYLWANWTGLAVRHLMTSPPVTVLRSTSLEVATRKMERHHVHRLVVVADHDPTLPIGVISTSDLVRALAEEMAR